MGKIKGLLFDFNGTLFFDSMFHIEAFAWCYDKYGLPRQSNEYTVANIFGRKNEEIFRNNFKSEFTPEELDEFEQFKENAYMEICRQNPERYKLCDGVCEMFDYLKKNGIPYCIATGSPYKNVMFYFESFGLERWFTLDNIVYENGTFAGKPAPDIYRIAASRLGLSIDECAVFEDGTSGIISARAAEAASVIAVWEEGIPTPVTDKAVPDYIYHDFTKWKEILINLGLIK